jgi:hypothetical protein
MNENLGSLGEEMIKAGVEPVDKGLKIPRLGKDETEFRLTSTRTQIGVVNLRTSQISVRKRRDILDAPRVNPLHLIKQQYTLPFKLSDGTTGFPMPHGITVITGGTAEGKSSLVRQLGIPRLLAVEPPDDEEELLNIRLFEEFDHALLVAVLRSFKNPGQVQAIDSLRGPLFEISGAAGPKGISMPFFTQVTRVSNALARHGLSVLVPVNPLHGDPEYVNAFISMLSSAVPAMITLKGSDAKHGIFRGVVSDRQIRSGIDFTVDTNLNNEVTVEEIDFKIPDPEDEEAAFSELQLNQLKSLGESL